MNRWRFSRSPHTLDMIGSLPLEGQLAVMDLIDKLEEDPDFNTQPYGEDTGGSIRTRTATTGSIIAVVLINDTTRRITLLQINSS